MSAATSGGAPHRWLAALGALALGVAPLVPTAAQTAAKPIKIVFPFPAGSAGDTVSRIVAATLQTQSGRTVMVENRSGAGGITGTRSVVGAETDGTVIMIVLILYKTQTTWPGLAIVLTGLPVYLLWRLANPKPTGEN